ncbi:hypothetical protein DPMN_108704 [Dreissena polymorpha]|uniref:Uncharacterized protein n=1 Tax=Dreissena polymorpha TaxID=45954 RepID=A0A9D4K9A4_DREPO|nr:hypothetical protein DPMN_108704 [Dreissena polymorpha]
MKLHNYTTIIHTNILVRKTAPPPHPWRPCFFTDRDHLRTHLRYIYKTNLFTKFHDDWANNEKRSHGGDRTRDLPVARRTPYPLHHSDLNNESSRVHVIQLTGTIFELNSCINETNVLTKFHDNWVKNVTSRKNARPLAAMIFHRSGPFFKFVRDINKTNVLTNFHDDWAKIVTSLVFTRKNAPPTGGHVFHRTKITFELNPHIIKANILTKFHENWAKNLTSRVEKCSAHWRPCFFTDWTIFELVRDINKTNVLTNFHDDWAKIVPSRVFTRKNAPPTGGHVFQRTGTTFELNQHIIVANILTHFELDRDIIGTNLLAKFHENRTIKVASRVFTNKSHLSNQPCYSTERNHFEHNSRIKETNLLTKFHKIGPKIEKCPAHWRPYINKTNVLTNFHDDWAKIVTSRVFTRKTAPPTSGHIFQRTKTTFELNQHYH